MFEIEERGFKCIIVVVLSITKNLNLEFYIERKKFETFLLTNEKLDWELNNSDESGEHIQHQGTMSLEEYYESDKSFISKDIEEFIKKYLPATSLKTKN